MLAQVRFKGRLSRKELERKFRAWQSGENESDADFQLWSGYVRNRSRCKIGVAGIVKEYARSDALFVDWDFNRPPAVTDINRVLRVFRLPPYWLRYDKTARGWHIVIRLRRKLRPLQTVILQMRLGSDMKRETFNAVRAFSGKARNNPRWNMLFERKI